MKERLVTHEGKVLEVAIKVMVLIDICMFIIDVSMFYYYHLMHL